MMRAGSLALVLHAHLPWVRHPEYPHFMEEDWLYEAITETYIPLLRMMDSLERDGVPFALTMSMTPPLCEMLADPLLRDRYEARLDALIELARELDTMHRGTWFEAGAQDALATLEGVRDTFVRVHDRDLIAGFRHHQDKGALTIVTCGATHGLLALTGTYEGRRAQIEVARANYRKHFGRDPQGIWLGECAYQEGLDLILREHGIRFVFLETHGLTHAEPRPRYGHYRPIFTEHGVAAFGRDPACSRQVWSAEEGYPGDPIYREFYRDAGWDAPRPLLEKLLDGGPRKNVGLKLHRVTGRVALHEKQPYVPAWAGERVHIHARHFLESRVQQIGRLVDGLGIEPLLVAPYDAELFGHWWYEGPQFLEALFRAAVDYPSVRLTTPDRWLGSHPDAQICNPAPSSWGDQGFWDVWINGENAWIYRHLHRAEERMIEAATKFAEPTALEERALTQLGRELLLAQSSDWAFIISMKTTVPYAVKRTRLHLVNFDRLYQDLGNQKIDESFLAELESRSPIFSELDWRAWKMRGGPHKLGGVSSQPIP
jgi:1,4-alpha-glucan branching enzyme